jgi:hypothetical protein
MEMAIQPPLPSYEVGLTCSKPLNLALNDLTIALT